MNSNATICMDTLAEKDKGISKKLKVLFFLRAWGPSGKIQADA